MGSLDSGSMKIATLIIAIAVFTISPLITLKLGRLMQKENREIFYNNSKDAWVKTVLTFAGAMSAIVIAFINGSLDKSISQALFGICFFSSLASAWTIYKTRELIDKVLLTTTSEKRRLRIESVKKINNVVLTKLAFVSLVVGFLGFFYAALFWEKIYMPELWLYAFCLTGLPVLVARFSDAANSIMTKYNSDKSLGT